MTAADLLETIVAATRRSVEERERATPRAQLLDGQRRRPGGDAFRAALRNGPRPRVIAECKRRSPSRGILRRRYDPASHAAAYAAAGAAAISVLTEPTFFDGCLDHLARVRAAVDIPVLRKDFIVDEYQLAEAVAFGADAVLLIAGALDDDALGRLLRSAHDFGLAALVEVHDSDELARALAAGAEIVGVNSRNLRTLTVDPAVLERLAAELPGTVTAVAESGIRSGDDICRLSGAGYHAFLIGERLIVEEDPGAALQTLRAAARAESASNARASRERSEPAKRRARERVGESEGRSSSGKQ
jgi:indole-3-glycerol phosphate synthase